MNIIVSLLLIAFCLYMGVIYVSRMLITCGVILLFLFAASIIEVLLRASRVSFYIEAPLSIVDEGATFWVKIKTRIKRSVFGGKEKVLVEIRNRFHDGTLKRWIPLTTVGGSGNEMEFRLCMEEAGYYEARINKVRIESVTGMFYISKRQDDSIGFMVMPKCHMMRINIAGGVRNFIGDSDIYDEEKSGTDNSHIFEIRPYRPKDKMQHIHWKLSARTEELMVKEFSLPKPCAIILIIDTRRKSARTGAFLDMAASISYNLMDKDCPHFVAWYSKERVDVRRMRVDDEESFYLALNSLLMDLDVESEADARKEYKEKYRNEYYAHDLVLTMDMELYRDNVLVGKWADEKVEKICEELELSL